MMFNEGYEPINANEAREMSEMGNRKNFEKFISEYSPERINIFIRSKAQHGEYECRICDKLIYGGLDKDVAAYLNDLVEYYQSFGYDARWHEELGFYTFIISWRKKE